MLYLIFKTFVVKLKATIFSTCEISLPTKTVQSLPVSHCQCLQYTAPCHKHTISKHKPTSIASSADHHLSSHNRIRPWPDNLDM